MILTFDIHAFSLTIFIQKLMTRVSKKCKKNCTHHLATHYGFEGALNNSFCREKYGKLHPLYLKALHSLCHFCNEFKQDSTGVELAKVSRQLTLLAYIVFCIEENIFGTILYE